MITMMGEKRNGEESPIKLVKEGEREEESSSEYILGALSVILLVSLYFLSLPHISVL